MYTSEYEKKGFPFRDFLTKLILVIVFVLLLVLLLPKFIQPKIVQQNCADGKASSNEECSTLAYSSLTSQIFRDNLDEMKEAAVSYYTTERLPKNIGDKEKMTLQAMIDKKIITALIDKNNKAVDTEKSYVEITKMDNEYLLKVNIKDSEKEDYILVHLGCYNYCNSYLCEKNAAEETGFVKSSRSSSTTSYVAVTPSYTVNGNGSITHNPTPNTTVINHYYYESTGSNQQSSTTNNYYDNTVTNNITNNNIDNSVTNNNIDNSVTNNTTNNYYEDNDTIIIINNNCDQDCEEKPKICTYDKVTKTYYGANGTKVTRDEFISQCTEDEDTPDEPEQPKICTYDKTTNTYYGENGTKVTREQFIIECTEPEPTPDEPEQPKICTFDKTTKTYYGENGTVVTREEFINQCTEPEVEPTPSEDPEVKKCYHDEETGKYYGKDGLVVTEEEYNTQCTTPTPETKKCVYDEETGKYYGKDGNEVTEEEYTTQCSNPEPEKEYVYKYKKVTGATLSKWSAWSDWEKTSCDTKELACDTNNDACIKKRQLYERKEQIGTYKDTFTKQRQEQRQVASYTQKACSKYNYVIIDNTTYAITDTTTYTTIDKITTTKTTAVTKAGGWTYSGRSSYANPPRDTATTHYKFVGADFSKCTEKCTSLPNFYYDAYNYTQGDISVTTSTTHTPITTEHTDQTVSETTESTVSASCGELVTKEIPVYRTIEVTDKSTINKPLYGTVCYKSEKTREVIEEGKTKYKWSTYNDQSLLNDGWVMTGEYKEA